MELEAILVLIGNFGFPIVIALYLLLRFEKDRWFKLCN